MNKDYKYRFKTVQEFEDTDGPTWRRLGAGFIECMDYLLGTEIDRIHYEHLIKDGHICIGNDYFRVPKENDYGHWDISMNMIIRIELNPSYKPKTFIRE